MNYTLSDIAKYVGGEVVGDSTTVINGLAKIQEAGGGDLTFISNDKYIKYASETRASAIIVSNSFDRECTASLIKVDDPYFAFLKVIKLFFPPKEIFEPGIHNTAVVDETAEIDDTVTIGALTVISKNVRIGKNVIIHPGVIIYPNVIIGDETIIFSNSTICEGTQIGKRVIIHCGAVIGDDGFGFVHKDGHYYKLPQAGIVILEDDVEVGANVTIDRATLGHTIIHRGAKLDNLIQIAHNVEVGEDTVMAAQTGVSGSTRFGRGVRVGGQVGFVGHITIGDESMIGAQAGISKDVPPGKIVTGTPAQEISTYYRSVAALHKLPDLLHRIKKLEKEIDRLREEKK